MSTTYFSLASGSLIQNWSNTSQITTNDDWSGVSSIQGFLGQDITTAIGADPRTLTGDSSVANDVDAIANQNNPNTNTSGGVAEFDGIADPTVALQGSGTADAPHLVLYLDAIGRQNVRVQFDARDIDGSADNATQQLNVQYRIGDSGPWINVTNGYFPDVTTSGTATQVTGVDVTLPSDADNQAQVQVRIMTTNATGSDEWVGIDNINVSSAPVTGPTPAGVAINDVSIVEGDAGAQLLTFTVTRSDNTGDFTVDYTTANGTAVAGSDFVGVSGVPNTLHFTAGGALTQQVSITINGDTRVEANETFSVNLGNLHNNSGTAELGDSSGTGTILNDDITRISSIQGTGHISPLLDQIVTTRGVVTAIDTNGSRGFYIQDPNGDGNAATSDAVFVFMPSGTLPNVGHMIEVTGRVSEFTPAGSPVGTLSTTELGSVTNMTDLGVGPAITPTVIGGPGGLLPPTESLIAGNTFYEKLEGMLVTVQDAHVVGPTNNFGEIFTVVDNDNDPTNGVNATGQIDRGNLLITPGNPDFGDQNTSGGDYNPERIQIDDDNGILSGFVSPDVNVGAQLTDVTGIVNYEFGNYQVVATQVFGVAQASTITKETGTLTGNEDHLLVASYNAENLDPTDGPARFTTIANEILTNLHAPDIISLQEVQDNDGAADSGETSADVTLQMLADALNGAAPAGVHYAFIDNPFIGNDTNGGEPGGNIRTAYLYRTDRVDFVDDSLATLSADGTLITDPLGNTDQQENPDNPFYQSRPPLVATFTFNGQDVTIVNNHFTSKGGSGPLYGSDQPPLNAGEVTRAAQAQAVNNFVGSLLASDPDAKVIVAGDLNEFPTEEPMAVLRGEATISNYDVPGFDPIEAAADYTPGGTAVLHDLLETLPANERYDYVFEGNSQTLDHVMVTGRLADHAQFDVVRINAEFADQTSDHDPLVASFLLEAPEPPPYRLQILHFYGETGTIATETAPILGAMIDKFDDEYANTLVLAEGDTWIPGPWLVAGADPSLNAIPGIGATALARPDIAIMNALGVDASALGNHEFDLGSPVVSGAIAASGAWAGAQFPFITANLDFAGDTSLRPLADGSIGGNAANNFAGQEASAIKGKIAPWTVVTMNGEKIGIVGATTYDLLSKTSPNGTVPKDDGNPSTDDLQEVAGYIQAAVDAMEAQGINKIVMLDQLDTIERNKLLAPMVSGIDIMVAGGGHERMGDANDVPGAFNGHSPTFVPDGYPIVTADAEGESTLIVTTDTEFTYLGRLVVDFDSSGHLILDSLDDEINGAYASNESTLQKVYGTTESAEAIIDDSVIASKVEAIADAIGAIVEAKDGNKFGFSDVYLEGDRVFARNEETNLGDVTADANAWVARQALGTTPYLVSLKNGGGLRASIGSIDEDGGKVANPATPEGNISQLDVENSLRFDNKLMVFDTTPQGLLNILNWGAGMAPNSGGFPQIGGVRFSYDPDLPGNGGTSVGSPIGSRVMDVALVDENGEVVAMVVDDGVIVPGAPALIRVVALNFTANGGDGYPTKANGENFRFLLNDGTLSAPVDESLDFTAVGVVPANALGEQKAFENFLEEFHDTPEHAYDQADTPQSGDLRIQNVNVRDDTVLDDAAPVIVGDLSITVNEGQTVVITTDDLNEADPDHSGVHLTYLVSGSVHGDVLLNGVVTTSFTQTDLAAGLVSFRQDGTNATDASFTVTLQDSPGLVSAPATVTASVVLDNQAPVFTSSDAFSIQENKTAVGTVTATDPDGDQFAFAITGGDDAEFFAINPNTGALSFLHSPDFETREDNNTDNIYNVTVSATDSHGEAATQAISVSVTNVSEPGQTFNGGNGNQTLVGTTGNDTMNGGNGNDNLDGNDGNDTISGGNDNDTIAGGRGNDSLRGDNGNDSLDGGLGNDQLEGGNGRDSLAGGAGDDHLEGNNDHDVLDGGAGNDRLTGGNGDDLFVFGEGSGEDVITDFDSHGDRIVINDGLFQNFQELRAASHQVGSNVVITLDADNTITLQQTQLNSLHSSDFLFHA